MRILFLAHRIPVPPNKGDKIRALWQLKALSKAHEVDLFCFCDDPADMEYADELKKYCQEIYVEPLTKLRSRTRAVRALLQGEPFSLHFFRSDTMRRRVQEAYQRRGYDAVVAFSSSMAPYAEELPIRRVADIVDCDSEKWHEYARQSGMWASWFWKMEGNRLGAYEDHLARTFEATTLCTEAEAALLRSRCSDGRILELAHPVDLDYWNPSKVEVTEEIRRFGRYVIFSGSMDYLPNVDAVVFFAKEVLPKLRSIRRDLQFVIAGRAPAREVRLLDENEPGVIATGTVEDIRPYLKGAAAAVSPLRIARGVQNKILEAMAMGLPVVTTRKAAAAFPDDFRRLLRMADEPEDIAAAVLHAIDSKPNVAVRQAITEHFGQGLDEKLCEIVTGAKEENEARKAGVNGGRPCAS